MGAPAPGDTVAGRFVLDRVLGQGGMGVVWAATHSVTRKAVALKLLKPDRAADPVVRERFLREARAASAVAHPNIIEIRDVLELEDGTPMMVMDLLRGESLGERLEREKRLPLDELAPIMLQVLSAVGTAHAAGIVHRDLKPDNIFLVEDAGRVSVRVLDFGIAKILSPTGELPTAVGLTGTGAFLGTPFYMAPEQLYGERDTDQRADVWALGVILYECLAGRRPTEGENVGQILRIITTESIPPLEELAPEVPDEVAQLVGRMLRYDRASRPGSLVEAFSVLSRHAPLTGARSFSEPTIPAMPAAPSSPGGATFPPRRAVISTDGNVSPTAVTLASTTASTTADRMVTARPARRGTLGVVVALAIAAVAAGGAVVVMSARSPSEKPQPSTAPAAASPPPEAVQPAAPAAPAGTTSPPSATSPSGVPSATAVASAPAPRRARPDVPPARAIAPPAASTPPQAPPKANVYEHM